MKQFEYEITEPIGIHARPAGELVKFAKEFSSSVTITKDGKSADAKRLIALMSLGVKQGNKVSVSIEGDDEDDAAAKIETYFKEKL